MARFQNILETVGNTPVVRINKLAPPDVNLYVKIEAFNPLGSVKDRLALGVIEAAERSGELKPGQTVIEATSGNTGIGLAMVCAQKGYPLVITMAETFSVERRKLMRFLGAKVVLFTRRPRADPPLAMRASLRWGSSDERDDGVTHGRQAWLRRRFVDSFFPASLF
jgi:cysteine synthase